MILCVLLAIPCNEVRTQTQMNYMIQTHEKNPALKPPKEGQMQTKNTALLNPWTRDMHARAITIWQSKLSEATTQGMALLS